MFRRKLIREFPVFFTYTLSHVIRSAVLFWFYHRGDKQTYDYAFVVFQVLDAGLALGVIYELLLHQFRSYEGIQRVGWLIFRYTSALLLILAVVAAASTPGKESPLAAGLFALEKGANVFCGGLLLLLFLFSRYLGLGWKHYAFGIALGLGVSISVELAAYTIRIQFGALSHDSLSLISAVSYNCAILIWVAYLALPERAPVAQPLPARAELESWNQALVELLHQ